MPLTIAAARQDYLDHLAERNKAHGTVATYTYALDRFFDYLGDEGITPEAPIDSLTADQLRRYGRHLYRLRLATTTRQTYLVVVRNWLRYLVKSAGLELNPDAIELPKIRREPPHPDQRLATMLNAPAVEGSPAQQLIALRDRAILATLYATQLRVSELIGLDRETIDWERGLAVVTGKGGRTRTVFFSDSAIQRLNTYLDARADAFAPLFIHHDRAHKPHPRDARGEGMRLTRQTVEALVRKYARAAGVKATPHTFRHYGATELLRNGADIRTVQELLGHASVATTQIYTHVSATRLHDQWRRFHPAIQDEPPS
ncbi:MAG: tyrosine-type recombinase/integrase [Chloroflexi bacterium]|nr:tyrosine-type recombinase/integrase [Chloroflexota bacterium]